MPACTHTHTHTRTHIYIYIQRERERERKRETGRQTDYTMTKSYYIDAGVS